MRKLNLCGLDVSIEIPGRTFELSTGSAPSDSGFRSRGFAWEPALMPPAPGMALPQQMLLANGGALLAPAR